ncbi:MAG: hypothetical protein AAF824_01125 [Bacteroidota bacterium]
MSDLAPCKTCKKDISPRAEVCPNCGEPQPVSPSSEESTKIHRDYFSWWLTGIIMFIAYFWTKCSVA